MTPFDGEDPRPRFFKLEIQGATDRRDVPAGADPYSAARRVMAAGDFMLARHPEEFPPESELVAQLLRPSALAFANLEMVLTEASDAAFKPSTVALRGDPDVAGSLVFFGLDGVSLANNHTMDFGAAGLTDTLAALDRHGVRTVGAGWSEKAAAEALVRDVSGTTVAVLGMSCTVPSGSMAEGEDPGICGLRVRTSFEVDPFLMMEQPGTAPRVRTVMVEEDVARAQDVIRAASETADVVVVLMHWGVPPAAANTFLGGALADYQRPLGHALIDAGADIILGHHPHAVQGYEAYQGKAILYSLGHLAFEAHMDFMSTAGLVADFAVSPAGIGDVRLWPLVGSRHGLPRFARPDEAAGVFDDIRRQSVETAEACLTYPEANSAAPIERGA